ncbi:acyltransferase family protein [Aeromicrobium sp. SMF47]|uniref:acyltransferase family protein n=1 Tax=Aeromicrobium yanjiei TaxID=2662028 RepID=UPI00129EDE0D|nr:acyltransferase family protein [Aeromicrobium yanjiei]MRJ75303.1 acyltransferase family protein [Aeromicrobium yanjiei]
MAQHRSSRRRLIGGHVLRADVQALRALAVVAVVVYHLWPEALPGGFTGVDVFFVISGFLITDHLAREVDRTGTLDLRRFWAGRARRLLPASLLVLLVTAVAVLLTVPRNLQERFLTEVAASALYVQNWQLARDSVDYLGAENLPSPVQHFWSLSVEEQFYVGLPMVIIVAILAARLFVLDRYRAIFGVLVIVTALSFAYSIHLSSASPGTAYFSTFTRGWEFGLGGIAAFAPPLIATLTRRGLVVVRTAAVLAFAAIIGSMVVIDGDTPFPDWAAAVPVLATVVLMRWGVPTFMTPLGRFAPVALLGRISYSLYLWHWPLIVIVPFITLHPLTTSDKIAIFAAAVILSWLSTRCLEEPIRFWNLPRLRPSHVLGATLAAMAPVMVVALAGRAYVEDVRSDEVTASAKVLDDLPACVGAAAIDADATGCGDPLGRPLTVVDPAVAAQEEPDFRDCWATNGVEELNMCSFGPQTGYDLHLFAVGDSHAAALLETYRYMAEKNDWRIDVAAHAGCYWTAADIDLDGEDQEAACRAWQANLTDHLRESKGTYDAVLTTHATSLRIGDRPEGLSRTETVVWGLVEAWKETDAPVVAIVDNPRSTDTNAQCVERNGVDDPQRCGTSRSYGLRRFDGNAEAVAQSPRAALVDMTDYYCTATRCPSVIGGVSVYRDQTHLTTTYVRTLAPYLDRRVRKALRELEVVPGAR